MVTRLSKIARLPAHIREQLNRRLHDGKLSNHILPWINSLPETKEILAELFSGKPITHQNLSEWRRAGYQDWLFHQQRLEWFTHLAEQSKDIQQHDRCPDTFETMANIFLFEIGQALNVMKATKNPNERCDRLQNLIREFARLQNAYNWSRRVELDFAKHNSTLENSGTGVPPVRSNPGPPGYRRQVTAVPRSSEAIEKCDELPSAGGASVPASLSLVGDDVRSLKHPDRQPAPHSSIGNSSFKFPTPDSSTPQPLNSQTPVRERQEAGAPPDAPRNTEATEERASVPDCGSPLPLLELNSLTRKPLNSPTPPTCQPIPPLATPTSIAQQFTPHFLEEINKIRKTRYDQPPIRGRRFLCIEG